MRDIKDLQPEGNWKICVDHPGHIVYDDGRCWSLLRDRFLIPQPNGTSDYTFFTLNKRKCYVHRLVATNFLENPDGLRDVHHLDSNTKNNHISNLQWLSHKDNCRAKILIDPKERVKTHPNSFIYYNGSKLGLRLRNFETSGSTKITLLSLLQPSCKYSSPSRFDGLATLRTVVTLEDFYLDLTRFL